MTSIAELDRAVQRKEVQVVDVRLRACEYQRAAHGQLLDRGRSLPVQLVLRLRVAQIKLNGIRVVAERRVQRPDAIVGKLAPPIPVQRPPRHVEPNGPELVPNCASRERWP